MWNLGKPSSSNSNTNQAPSGYGWNSNVPVPKSSSSVGWNIPPTPTQHKHFEPEVASTTRHTESSVPEQPFKCRQVPKEMGVKYLVGERHQSSSSKQKFQNFYELRDDCLKRGKLFEDPEFPASDQSLYFSRYPDRRYEWLRPTEISRNPFFFVDGYSRFDIQQGELGDCWLLAAAATLTQSPKLFNRVVPEDNSFQKNYAGIFHFRFWQYGKWIDVVIDDRLPTYRGQLTYMRSSEQNEFWSALLEKAYAKLHGCYESLRGGTTCEAMEDFTGGIAEMYELNEAPNTLFHIMESAFNRHSMMSCNIEADPRVLEASTPQGLIRGHAYSVTLAKPIDIITPKMKGKIPLIRLRNPWGNEAEWKGAFSDGSPEWRCIPEHAKREIGLSFKDDGEFWMTYRDFLTYFDRIEICHLNPDSVADDSNTTATKNWRITTFEGEWVRGISAGGCRNFLDSFWTNPQYIISLNEPDEGDQEGLCTVVIALMQKNRRSRKNMDVGCLQVGFAIYKMTPQDLLQKPQKLNFFKFNATTARSPPFVNLREVSCRFRFSPGQYMIVPSTYEPNEEGEFLIRIFTQSKNKMIENDQELSECKVDDRVKKEMEKPARAAPEKTKLWETFQILSGDDKIIDWTELQQLLNHSMRDIFKEGFSKELCRSILAMLDTDLSGGLGFEEFVKLFDNLYMWKVSFRLYAKEGSDYLNGFELRDALGSAGFHLNHKILNALMHRYGTKDGKIQFDDFLVCAIKVKVMIEAFKEKDKDNRNEATFTLDEWISRTIYS